MSDEPVQSAKPWRWTCPHCGGGSMSLESAVRHLRRKHSDCWSCRIEKLVVVAISEGRGHIVAESEPLYTLLSRARS